VTGTELPPEARVDPSVGLRWAVKQSFLSYLARTPDARAFVSGGVRANADSEVIFPPAEKPRTAVGDEVSLAFTGEVRYLAYSGLLHVIIAEPMLTLRDGVGVLTIAAVDDEERPIRVELVSFTASTADMGASEWEAVDVRLTADGATVFGDVYTAGELMAPLYVHLPPPR
jgi:hypothetical protein